MSPAGHPGWAGASSEGAEAPVGEQGGCTDSWLGYTVGLSSSLLSLQPPKGVDRAPSTCGAGARRGQAGVASLCCLWSSWPGCSGHPPTWPTSHSAPVPVSLPTQLHSLSVTAPPPPHLRLPLSWQTRTSCCVGTRRAVCGFMMLSTY